jgi:hypothetical protein
MNDDDDRVSSTTTLTKPTVPFAESFGVTEDSESRVDEEYDLFEETSDSSTYPSRTPVYASDGPPQWKEIQELYGTGDDAEDDLEPSIPLEKRTPNNKGKGKARPMPNHPTEIARLSPDPRHSTHDPKTIVQIPTRFNRSARTGETTSSAGIPRARTGERSLMDENDLSGKIGRSLLEIDVDSPFPADEPDVKSVHFLWSPEIASSSVGYKDIPYNRPCVTPITNMTRWDLDEDIQRRMAHMSGSKVFTLSLVRPVVVMINYKPPIMAFSYNPGHFRNGALVGGNSLTISGPRLCFEFKAKNMCTAPYKNVSVFISAYSLDEATCIHTGFLKNKCSLFAAPSVWLSPKSIRQT